MVHLDLWVVPLFRQIINICALFQVPFPAHSANKYAMRIVRTWNLEQDCKFYDIYIIDNFSLSCYLLVSFVFVLY